MVRQLTIILVIALAACSKSNEPDPISRSDREIVLQNLGNQVIIGAFLNLQTSVNALETATKSYVVEPTDTRYLLNLHSNWNLAAASWKRSLLFILGPLDKNRLSSQFFSIPNTQAIESIINQSQVEIDSNYVASLPATQKGLLAVEYLIFGTEGSNTKKIIDSFTSPNGKRRLSYLEEIVKNLKNVSNSPIYTWSKGGEGYVTNFIASDGNDRQSSIAILVAEISKSISKIKNERIGIPLGIGNNGSPIPSAVEGIYSNESIMLIKSEIEGIERAFTGNSLINPQTAGINFLLNSTGAKYGEILLHLEIQNRFSEIYNQLNILNLPLQEAIKSKKTDVQHLYELVEQLEALVNTEVTQKLFLQK